MENSQSVNGRPLTVLDEVIAERARQDGKWGVQRHNPFIWMSILGEEVGEANEALLESHFAGNVGYNGGSMEEYRKELIQVAAVAVAAVEACDSGEVKEWSNPESVSHDAPSYDPRKIYYFNHDDGQGIFFLIKIEEAVYTWSPMGPATRTFGKSFDTPDDAIDYIDSPDGHWGIPVHSCDNFSEINFK